MTSKIIAGLIGAALALYAFVYLPMARNHAECGKITLCAQGTETRKGQDRETGLGAKHDGPVAESDAPENKSVNPYALGGGK